MFSVLKAFDDAPGVQSVQSVQSECGCTWRGGKRAQDPEGLPYWSKPDGSVLKDLKANMGHLAAHTRGVFACPPGPCE